MIPGSFTKGAPCPAVLIFKVPSAFYIPSRNEIIDVNTIL